MNYLSLTLFLLNSAVLLTYENVMKTSKRRRSIRSTYLATVVGTSYELDGKRAIRLNAIVSDRILEYPTPVTVTAELKIEEFPIIAAEVFASIVAPNQPVIRLPLFDDGIFPDELANDGLYTNDVVKLPKSGRYSVSVTALSNNTAMLVPKTVNYFLKDVVDCSQISCTKLGKFQRETDVGSIKVKSDVVEDSRPKRLPEFKFALKSIGANDAISEVSNIAAAVIEEKAVEEQTVAVEKPAVTVKEEPVLMTMSEAEVQHLPTNEKVCKPVFWNHPIVGRVKLNFC